MSFAKVRNSWDVLKPVQSKLFSSIKSVALYRGTTGDCALLVTHDGAVYVVGKSTVGCLGLEEVTKVTEACLVKEITNVSGVSMCGGYGDVLAVTTEGKVYSWGSNSNAALKPTLKSELHNVVDAKCSYGNYLALTKDGKVYQWKGVTFHGLAVITNIPTVVQISEVVVSIACGSRSSLVATKNGSVFAWGKEYTSGQVMPGSFSDSVYSRNIPEKKIILEESIIKVACCSYYNLVLTKSGKIFSWGRNSDGLGDGNTASTSVVQIGSQISNFVDIAVSYERCAAATENKCIYIWGKGAKATISKAPDYNDMYQFFAGSESTSFLWIYKTRDFIDLEGFGPMREKLKNSFNCEDWSDLTLIIDEKPIYVNTFILKLRSNYFYTMLQEYWTDKNTREIKLSSFNYDAYYSYFWYLYSGEVETSIENILELWSLAHEYDEENLKIACKKLMERNLSFKDLAEQAVLMKRNKTNTYQEDLDDSASRLQSEHMSPKTKNLTLATELLDMMQKDFTIKLESLTKDYNKQQDELASLQNKIMLLSKYLLETNYSTQQEEFESLRNERIKDIS